MHPGFPSIKFCHHATNMQHGKQIHIPCMQFAVPQKASRSHKWYVPIHVEVALDAVFREWGTINVSKGQFGKSTGSYGQKILFVWLMLEFRHFATENTCLRVSEDSPNQQCSYSSLHLLFPQFCVPK